MSDNRWERIQALYLAALEHQPAQRRSFLNDACQSDEEVRREVESLLAYEGCEPDILNGPVWENAGRPALQPGTTFGAYHVVRLLGVGGMGEVYQARDEKLARYVALKILSMAFAKDRSRLARFERESRLLASLNHPHIGAIYGLEEDHGLHALVLEFVDGPTLADRIARGPLPAEEALAISGQIADALEYAHDHGVVHRDLKPANVKIRLADQVVKVLDFGLAKTAQPPAVASPTSKTTTFTETISAGLILGTPAYMSPEQARGKATDKRCDIWSFGVLLYEMLSGRRPFAGDTVSDTLAAVLTAEPHWEEIPDHARGLLRKCLEKDAKQRLRDIGDAKLLLEPIDNAQISPAPRRMLPAILALLAVAALGFAWLFLRKQPPLAETVRFRVNAPQDTRISTRTPRLSPDGRHLAFSVAAPGGRVLIWIRDLDSEDARPLDGTEGATGFFWSPDSRFLAYGADGKLKKIAVSGGSPQNLCDAPVPVLGGSWNHSNVILFAGALGNAISRVSAGGGVPTAITMVDRGHSELFHSYPSFLPDDHHFLYLRIGDRQRGVFVGNLDAKPEDQDTHQVLATGYSVAFAPNGDSYEGNLLFVQDAALMAQPFDARHLKLLGEPIPVTDSVLTYRTDGYFSASSNGVLAFRGGGGRQTALRWFDRDGIDLGPVGQGGEYRHLALSPDGSRAAVSRRDPKTQTFKFDVWVLDLARNTNMPVAFNGAFPVWSGDGQHIAYSSREPRGRCVLFQTGTSGAAKEECLAETDGEWHPTDWSRQGGAILYSHHDPKNKSDLWVQSLAGDRKLEPYRRTEFNEDQGQFSPDARWIAYVSDESGRNEIYVQSYASAQPDVRMPISTQGGSQPRWRPDGRELFFISPEGSLMSVQIGGNPTFQHSAPKALFPMPLFLSGEDFQRYSVSRDGQKFLVIADTGDAASTPITVVLNWTALLKR